MIVTISDNFDLQKISDSGQCFRCRQIGDFYQFITDEEIIYLRQIAPEKYEVLCSEETWAQIRKPYFDLDRSYREIRSSITGDSFLEKAAAEGAGIRVLRQDSWEMLISFIISQLKVFRPSENVLRAWPPLLDMPSQQNL